MRTSALRLPSGASLGRGSVAAAWAGTWLRTEMGLPLVPVPRTPPAAVSSGLPPINGPAEEPASAPAPVSVPAPAPAPAPMPALSTPLTPPPSDAASCLAGLRTLTAAAQVAATVEALTHVVSEVTGADRVGVWLVTAGGRALEAASGSEDVDVEPVRLALGDGLVGRCAAESRSLTGLTTGSQISGGGAAPHVGDGRDPSVATFRHAAVPLLAGGELIGVLDAGWATHDEPGAAHGAADGEAVPAGTLAVLELAASVAAPQLELLRLRDLGSASLDRDPETGLLHAHRLRRDCAQECARTHRYGEPFSLLVVVVEAAQAAGHGPDAPLPVAADLVHAHVRASDAVYRFGPDAVAVLAPHTGAEGAASLAARLAGVLQRRFAAVPDVVGTDPETGLVARTRWEWVTVPADATTADEVLDELQRRLGLPPR